MKFKAQATVSAILLSFGFSALATQAVAAGQQWRPAMFGYQVASGQPYGQQRPYQRVANLPAFRPPARQMPTRVSRAGPERYRTTAYRGSSHHVGRGWGDPSASRTHATAGRVSVAGFRSAHPRYAQGRRGYAAPAPTMLQPKPWQNAPGSWRQMPVAGHRSGMAMAGSAWRPSRQQPPGHLPWPGRADLQAALPADAMQRPVQRSIQQRGFGWRPVGHPAITAGQRAGLSAPFAYSRPYSTPMARGVDGMHWGRARVSPQYRHANQAPRKNVWRSGVIVQTRPQSQAEHFRPAGYGRNTGVDDRVASNEVAVPSYRNAGLPGWATTHNEDQAGYCHGCSGS